MKAALQQNLDKINAMVSYNPNQINDYKALIINCIAQIKESDPDEKSPIYNAWTPTAIEEFERSLEKMNDSFLQQPIERQRTEFMYSKSSVSLALTNLVMNL